MADSRPDYARGRNDGPLLRHPDTGHEVVPTSKAVEEKFRSRGYKAAGSTTTTAKKTTRKSTAKKTTSRKSS